jgi:DNA-binding winged helix-turn-helix (wHTH) protein
MTGHSCDPLRGCECLIILPELKLLPKDRNKVDLTARALFYGFLIRASGEVGTKDELIEQVWAGSIVEENNLQTHISAIRRSLKQDPYLIISTPENPTNVI